MIKIPEGTPDWQILLKDNFKNILKLSHDPEIQKLIEKTDQEYYYWDKVRCQPLLKEFDRKEIWAFIRFRRQMNSFPTPILDIGGEPFYFWLPDNVQKSLHLIDQSMGGKLAFWDPDSDKKSSSRYMVASLMEEAITSSQIEGAVATIKDAKKMLLEKRSPKNKSERMIFNNYQTMQSLKEICKKDLSIKILLELHVMITNDTLDTKEEEGRFRSLKDSVNVVTNYGEILFTPPLANEIQERLEALVRFANEKDDKPFIHPVVKAVLLHFWMAYVHPFTDGNGRMARTLFYWYMLKNEYWLFEYTSISKTILKRTTKYAYSYLYSEHDSNDLTYFIHFNIAVIMDAIEELKRHLQEEKERNQRVQLEISEFPELNFRQMRLVQHIISHPQDILTIKIHQNSNKLAYQTARTDLQELESMGWLKSVKKGNQFFYIPTDHFWFRIRK